MGWFNNLRMKKKIYLVLGVMIAVVLFILVLEMFFLTKDVTRQLLTEKLHGDIKSVDHYVSTYYGKFLLNASGELVDSNGLPIDNRFEMVDELSKDLNVVSTIFVRQGDDYVRISTNVKKDNGERAIGTKLGKSSAAYEPITQGKQYVGNVKILGKSYIAGYSPVFDDKKTVIGILFIGIAETSINKFINSNMSATSIRILIGLLVLGVFCIIMGIFLAKSVTDPIIIVRSFAQRISTGDFTDRIQLEQKDELGELASDLNVAAEDLENLLREITFSARALVKSIDDIAAENENLSERTNAQASALEEVATNIEETIGTISQTAENSKKVDHLSRNAALLANDGETVVGETVIAIDEISNSSKKIEEINTVINDISFQTNLLALNAAVEAARAGDHGRGFAVVAGEVRKLAQNSSNAAKEISELIKDSRAKVKSGTELAKKTGDVFESINKSIHDMSRLLSEISTVAEEQRLSITEINTAITELDSMTHQNSGLVELTANASENMSAQAKELLVMISHFKIKDQTIS